MRGVLGSGARTIGSRGSRLCALRASFDAFAPLPEGAFTGVSHGAGPAAAEAEQCLALVGIANGSVGGNGDDDSYLLPHPSDSSAILQDRKRLLLPGERTRHFSFCIKTKNWLYFKEVFSRSL